MHQQTLVYSMKTQHWHVERSWQTEWEAWAKGGCCYYLKTRHELYIKLSLSLFVCFFLFFWLSFFVGRFVCWRLNYLFVYNICELLSVPFHRSITITLIFPCIKPWIAIWRNTVCISPYPSKRNNVDFSWVGLPFSLAWHYFGTSLSKRFSQQGFSLYHTNAIGLHEIWI